MTSNRYSPPLSYDLISKIKDLVKGEATFFFVWIQTAGRRTQIVSVRLELGFDFVFVSAFLPFCSIL